MYIKRTALKMNAEALEAGLVRKLSREKREKTYLVAAMGLSVEIYKTGV